MKNEFNQKDVMDRIMRLQQDKGSSPTAFARLIGIDPANYSKKIKCKQPWTNLDINKICQALGLNKDWLITGEGSMFEIAYTTKFDLNKTKESLPTNVIPSLEVTDYEYIGKNKNGGIFFTDQNGVMRMSVPHVPYAARAEFVNPADDLEPNLDSWDREIYVVDKKVSGKYLSFDVKGDSMDNGMKECLQDGDKVLVRELERDFWVDLHINEHKYWVLVFGSSVLIKQIVSEDRETGKIICHSLNPSPEYSDFEVYLDDVRALYYVVKIKPRERSV